MIKFISKVSLFIFVVFSMSSQAGLIETDLTTKNYITYKNIDWAWASPVSIETFGSNILKAADTHEGWRSIDEEELFILQNELTIADFTAKDEFGVEYIIQAVEYWNTYFTHVDQANFEADKISLNMVTDSGSSLRFYETFYVRDVQVPEPSTIMIFAIALIALSMRKRVAK